MRCSVQRRERVRARRAQRDAEAVGEREQVAPAVAERRGGLGERLAAPRLDLDLRRDQLARGVGAERRRVGQRLQLLEPVDHAERLGVEDLELLLDPDREVGRLGEEAAGLVEGGERSRERKRPCESRGTIAAAESAPPTAVPRASATAFGTGHRGLCSTSAMSRDILPEHPAELTLLDYLVGHLPPDVSDQIRRHVSCVPRLPAHDRRAVADGRRARPPADRADPARRDRRTRAATASAAAAACSASCRPSCWSAPRRPCSRPSGSAARARSRRRPAPACTCRPPGRTRAALLDRCSTSIPHRVVRDADYAGPLDRPGRHAERRLGRLGARLATRRAPRTGRSRRSTSAASTARRSSGYDG